VGRVDDDGEYVYCSAAHYFAPRGVPSVG
jgi:hypothetical protein